MKKRWIKNPIKYYGLIKYLIGVNGVLFFTQIIPYYYNSKSLKNLFLFKFRLYVVKIVKFYEFGG